MIKNIKACQAYVSTKSLIKDFQDEWFKKTGSLTSVVQPE